jgi:amino acid adenylation domain-containing protein
MPIINQLRTVAAAHPSRIALADTENEMSFGELVRRVNGLASALNERSCGPGTRVAIVLPRSFEMIVAMLGVMASGAAFLPLDPAHPPARLLSILEDAQPSLLLMRRETDFLSHNPIIPVLDPGEWPEDAQPVTASSNGDAYTIYTSGSTGQPKGVDVEHAALENYVRWAMEELPFKGGGVPLFTSISFDHALTNIFPPLLQGEKIILLPSIEGGRNLASALLDNKHAGRDLYSFVKIMPSLFGFLNPEQRAHLGRITHLLMFGGERLPPSFVHDARRDRPSLPIMNHYGPTEATIGCCVYRVPPHFKQPEVPVGQPIPGVKAKVMEPDKASMEKDDTGELLIGGLALAEGYWQKPELTAKAFITITAHDGAAERWYRTGDLVRKSGDGNLLYLGRIDRQIKILGNRIEPEEVTNCITSFPGVGQSAVFALERSGLTELLAAVVFQGDKADSGEIRKHLQAHLPPAMVPSRILVLDEMPLSESGKIDERKLATMLPVEAGDLSVEEAVEEKFREILGLDKIDRNGDYFLLGGDSMGTVEIATWAAETYKIPIELSCLFDYPSVGSLSEHISSLMEMVNKH